MLSCSTVDCPQKEKSRLFTIADEIFEACDEVVTETAETMVRTAAQSAEANGFQATLGDDGEIPPITVKSICLQSFTFTEVFFLPQFCCVPTNRIQGQSAANTRLPSACLARTGYTIWTKRTSSGMACL